MKFWLLKYFEDPCCEDSQTTVIGIFTDEDKAKEAIRTHAESKGIALEDNMAFFGTGHYTLPSGTEIRTFSICSEEDLPDHAYQAELLPVDQIV